MIFPENVKRSKREDGLSRRDVVDQLYAPRRTNQNANMLLFSVIMLGKRAEHPELASPLKCAL